MESNLSSENCTLFAVGTVGTLCFTPDVTEISLRKSTRHERNHRCFICLLTSSELKDMIRGVKEVGDADLQAQISTGTCESVHKVQPSLSGK